MVCNAILSSLCNEFACGGFGELLYNENAEFLKGLIALGFGFPFADGWVKVPGHVIVA